MAAKSMDKEKKAVKNEDSKGLKAVEELCMQNNVPVGCMRGMRAMAGWAPGKQVTEEEFEKKLESFKKAPINGGR